MKNILLLPGDGIGPEIIKQAKKILDFLIQENYLKANIESGLIGGAAYDAKNNPLPKETIDQAKKSDAILLGAIGGPKYDKLDRGLRPERGLLRIRSELGLFANLRPAILFSQLIDASTLKPEVISGLDVMIVRELTGGIYFGEPRGIDGNIGDRKGYNTMSYHEKDISRIMKVAYNIAKKRSKRLCSVDKANVLEVSELWREIAISEQQKNPDVDLSHMYVDNAAMQLIKSPKEFDVIVTSNMFGDILSDCAAMLTGSIGMLPSASFDEYGKGLYEPVHGSAPDIADKDVANPLATILSLVMLLRYSFAEEKIAKLIEESVNSTLEKGFRTKDIYSHSNQQLVGCEEMGDTVLSELKLLF